MGMGEYRMQPMGNALVSVIIPMYNAECYIAETIESVLNQTWKNIELIIVDDGSSDNSLLIAQRYVSDKVFVYTQPNQGAPKARNLGFSYSQGDYIQYLDADDLLSPEKVEKQINALRLMNAENAIATCTFYQYINGRVQPEWSNLAKVNRNYDTGISLQIDLWRYFIPSYIPSCYLTPRHLVESVGGWNEHLYTNQDGEFVARVLTKVDNVVFVEKEYVLWRYVADSISHTHSAVKADSVLTSYIFIAELLLKNAGATAKIAIGIAFGYMIYYDIVTYKQLKKALNFLRQNYISPIYPSNSIVFRWSSMLSNPLLGRKINELYKIVKSVIWKRTNH